MSKIFSLREWLYLEDACKHLTDRFNEVVTVSDVMALVLEGRIPLSVRFEVPISARSATLCYQQPKGNYQENYVMVGKDPFLFLELSESVESMSGLFDLPMIGGEREFVSSFEWNGRHTAYGIAYDEIVLRNGEGRLVVPVRLSTPT